MSLKERIKRHEGLMTKPYYCTEGKLTIGYGRNLEHGITEEEASYLFDNDFERAKSGAELFRGYHELNEIRKGIVIEMVFQMGVAGVEKFKKFWLAIQDHDWASAAEEMLDSKWAKQTPERAKELARLFLRGVSGR